jgi:hypothetical protein
MTSPVFVALDTPDLARARDIATRVRHHVGGLKLGLSSSRRTVAPACAKWRRSVCRSFSI